MIFEGREATGEDSIIKRIAEHINPRCSRVVALEKNLVTKRVHNGAFKGILSTFQVPVRSLFLIEVSTIEQ
jgi:hypothetical protein